MKRALVIGGTGFLGLALVEALQAAGVEVTVTRRRHSITLFTEKLGVRWTEGDLDRPESLGPAMDGFTHVFLAGAHYPRYSTARDESIARGVAQVRNASEAARACGARLIYTSSIASLAVRSDGGASDETDIPVNAPTESVYRAVKWSMERELERQVAMGLDAVTLLPGGCLGPGDARLGTGGLMVGTVRGALPWMVDGWVHVVDVRDVAQAQLRAAQRAEVGARFVLSGHERKLSELLEHVAQRFGGRLPVEQVDVETARLRADIEEREAEPKKGRVSMPRELVDIIAWGAPLSSARAAERLGFVPRPLDETLDDAYAWFQRMKYVPRSGQEASRPA